MLSKISSATPWWVLCVEVCCGVEVGLGKNTKSIWPKYKVKYKVLSYVFLRRISTRILNAKGKYLCLSTPLRSITSPSPNTPSLSLSRGEAEDCLLVTTRHQTAGPGHCHRLHDTPSIHWNHEQVWRGQASSNDNNAALSRFVDENILLFTIRSTLHGSPWHSI